MTAIASTSPPKSNPRAWLVNGIDHALRLNLGRHGNITSGLLLRKCDQQPISPLRPCAADASALPTPVLRLKPDQSAALRRLWQRRPNTPPPRQDELRPDQQQHQVDHLLRRLGIDANTRAGYRLPLCPEPALLILAGTDRYDRPLWLRTDAARAWQRMREQALRDDIVLDVVSGFRSAEYQAQLIARKQARGLPLADILAVSALPGYSEHHLGTVLDLHAGHDPVLEESFERTIAFAWLAEHASRFGFHLSYPRDNPHGIAYEPWHWRYRTPV